MKEDLIKKIKSRGYWRFNFQPLTATVRLNHLKDCKEIVVKNSINLRGWDFPHIPLRQDNNGSIVPMGEYIEAWEDWSCYKEFWRMYKSGQFLYYRALREDWFEEHHWNPELSKKIESGKYLGALFSVIYEITELFLFLSRLIQNDLYFEGVNVNISLHNLKDRSLWLEDNNRMPFNYPRKIFLNDLRFAEKYSKDDIIKRYIDISTNIIIRVFENFNWDTSKDIIVVEQEKFLSGKIL